MPTRCLTCLSLLLGGLMASPASAQWYPYRIVNPSEPVASQPPSVAKPQPGPVLLPPSQPATVARPMPIVPQPPTVQPASAVAKPLPVVTQPAAIQPAHVIKPESAVPPPPVVQPAHAAVDKLTNQPVQPVQHKFIPERIAERVDEKAAAKARAVYGDDAKGEIKPIPGDHTDHRAGYPRNVRRWSTTAMEPHFTGGWVGGGALFKGYGRNDGSGMAGTCASADGTWGFDYIGCGFRPWRFFLNWYHDDSHKRQQGGTYKVDGPPIIDIFAIKPIRNSKNRPSEHEEEGHGSHNGHDSHDDHGKDDHDKDGHGKDDHGKVGHGKEAPAKPH